MDTIEEQSKSEDMSVSPTPSPKNLRICLVGNVAGDTETLEAAKSFGVPVVTSETGLDMVSDSGWTTYFIMNDFESPAFETIHKSEHRIMGPPALQQTAKSGDGLKHSSRPVYNYSMRGVITCFTGIRKKDELTRLVNLIHSMGGSIRKDMNSKVTHLICNTSGGEKYQYAMTFRLAVVRSDWVYKAWENRDVHNFAAVNEEFTKDHRLKAFEGQRICFFGFALDEHQHMVDVLKNNGGIPTELDDPECSHVIMANTGGHFPENIPSSRNSSQINSDDQGEHDKNHKSGSSDDSEKVDSPKTPLSSRIPAEDELVDGIVLTSNDENDFLNPNNLSSILSNNAEIGESQTNTDMITPIDEEDEEDAYNDDVAVKEMKRKRDSFDNVSLMSTDSIAIGSTSSAKKPKLIRTGSITRSIKRSMSFVGIRTPISNILRPRRNSVDPNASVSSITSVDITLNESIKKPVKEKIRSLRDRITRSTKRDINITPKAAKLASLNLSNLSKICKIKASDKCETPERPAAGSDQVIDLTDFKTPLLPKSNHSLTSSSTSTHRHSVSGIGSISSNLIDEARYSVNMPPVRKSYAADTSITQSIFAATGSRDFAIMNRNDPSANVATMNECDISICPTIVENHPVVDEHFTQAKPEPKNNKTHIVKSDWFWYTIQNGYADEADYLFGDYLDSIANTPGTDRRDSLPISFNKRKRKRFSQRIQTEGTPLGSGKRRSSVSDAGLLSVSGSFLDCTASPDKHDPAGGNNKVIPENDVVVEATPKNKSMRYNHFMDFYHTESNYVGILDTIVNLFKIPLEEKAETSDALLNKSEVRAIFSNFLPIHEVHRHMLERLKELQTKWSEECLIGQIILDHRDDLMKAYPPYVNFFEQMKETLILCDTQNPRFHAFLKINQAKPECGRQSLQDLMIRPVQRLPSISLLLNDILKHTNKNNPDNKKLEEALRSIKDVMAHINEDKRKTEGQLAMFDIFNDIDGCPAHLVSSHRQFVSKCEVTEVTDALSGRGNSLMLYLFTDTIEVCKKRSKGFNSGKSPSATKPFKHIKLMPLNTIKLVIDIKDSPRAFAVTCRHNHDNKEKLYAFIMCDEEIDKIIYLRSLCKQMAENACRTDTEKSLLQLSSSEVGVDTSDVNIGTLSKAFKFATQTRLKVTRAFSFNKTPSKLKRAVSTMMTSPFGSTNSLTPASQFSQMKLASCTNINEVGEEDNNSEDSPSSQSEILIAPMSVQPTRKAKNATISMAALRRI